MKCLNDSGQKKSQMISQNMKLTHLKSMLLQLRFSPYLDSSAQISIFSNNDLLIIAPTKSIRIIGANSSGTPKNANQSGFLKDFTKIKVYDCESINFNILHLGELRDLKKEKT